MVVLVAQQPGKVVNLVKRLNLLKKTEVCLSSYPETFFTSRLAFTWPLEVFFKGFTSASAKKRRKLYLKCIIAVAAIV